MVGDVHRCFGVCVCGMCLWLVVSLLFWVGLGLLVIVTCCALCLLLLLV